MFHRWKRSGINKKKLPENDNDRGVKKVGKLFYLDPYIKNFTAKILNHQQDKDSNWYVILDETAFYPTGGGQPHDIGILNDVSVIGVEEIYGEVRHYLEKPLEDVDGDVHGSIDWNKRFDHMQQHAGQHILSAAFEQLFQFKTISFHLGKETLTIDLDVEELTEQQLIEAERLANEIILDNRPIETKWVTKAELATYPIRKVPTVTDDIRLVIIPEFDYNGCGGTHPKATGEVGSIKILDWERQKKKVRVQFVCGKRVLEHLHQKHSIIRELTKLLNAPETEMVMSAKRLLENGKVLEKSLEDARETILTFEARKLLQKGIIINGKKQLGTVFQNRTIQELQKLARLITSQDETVIAVLVAENGDRLQLVAAKSSTVNGSMKKLVGELLPLLNGKGGGNDAMAQGGGEARISGEQLLQQAKDILKTNNLQNQ
jgi:alanyl-tRNA synthetase